MKINWISVLIAASALAILALITFQVRWMQHSQQLLEEQFNQRVNMALCNTVEQLAVEESCSSLMQTGCSAAPAQSCCQQLDTLLASDLFDETLKTALHFYQIDLPYRADIKSNTGLLDREALPPYSCTLNPLLSEDSHFLQLDFEDKNLFILAQMGGMVGSSIFILLLICTIFIMATYHLIRQKRMSDRNREFFNHMAHEFRTPLTNIRLAGKLLAKKEQHLQESPYLNIIHQEGAHLMEQVEQVLHLARLEKKDFHLQRTLTDVSKLIQETVQRMQLRQQECSADIQLELPIAPVFEKVDALHLGNAVRNLLDNSMKHCSARPCIRLRLSTVENGFHLHLQDNGRGWTEEEHRKVFEKFYQSKHGPQRKGFGLGLSYVQRVIDLHGGVLSVTSRPGTGTHFDILIPQTTTTAS